jgi:hypothetical protein
MQIFVLDVFHCGSSIQRQTGFSEAADGPAGTADCGVPSKAASMIEVLIICVFSSLFSK